MSWGSGRMVTYVDSLGSNKILHYKGVTGPFIGTFASMTGAPKGVLFARLSLRSLVSWGVDAISVLYWTSPRATYKHRAWPAKRELELHRCRIAGGFRR